MTKNSILEQALPTQVQAVKADLFDTATFSDMKESAETLQQSERKGTEVLKTFPPLVQDVFSSLYKYAPQTRNPEELKGSHRINHSLIQKAMQTEQYSQLRNYTKLDEVNSALATVTIANALIETIKEKELKELADQANQLAQAEEDAQQAQQHAQSLQDIANQCQNNNPKKAKYEAQSNAASARAQQAQQHVQQLQQKFDNTLPGAQQKIRQAIRAAEKQALNDIKDTADFIEAWGSEPGAVQQLPPEKRLEIAQKLRQNEKLKKLAKIVGRFRRLAVHAQKTKINRSQDEVHDIELGSDLNRVIPSELALLRNPITKREFGRKFVEGKLMQYKLRGLEKAGKGPIICCIDSSGSMAGDRELWAKAVALSLLDIAVSQKRSFGAIQFGARDDILDIITIQKGEKNIIEKVLHIASYFLNGGTDFEKPLNSAIGLINESEFIKADIVFISDGHCDVSEGWLTKFLQIKKEKEFRVHSVEIMGHSDTLRKFSDAITTANQLADTEAMEIFGGV